MFGAASSLHFDKFTPESLHPAWSLIFVLVLISAFTSCSEKIPDEPFRTFTGMGGNFELIDQKGHPFSSAKLHGRLSILFFGYTSCPDICPATLSNLKRVYSDLEIKEKEINTVFISVDTERDTPELLDKYLNYYDSTIIGLTGSKEKIDGVVKQFKAYYEIHPIDSTDRYTIDHSTYLYLMDPDGNVRYLFRRDDSLSEIKEILRAAQLKWETGRENS